MTKTILILLITAALLLLSPNTTTDNSIADWHCEYTNNLQMTCYYTTPDGYQAIVLYSYFS